MDPQTVLESHPQPDKPTPETVERAKLSHQLDKIAENLEDRPVSFGEIVITTEGRAYDLLLILLSVPFFSPVPIPLLSTVLGAIIALIGLRLAAGMKPWLPKAFLQKQIHAHWVLRMLKAGSAIMRRIEGMLRPRLAFVHRAAFFQRLTGVLIAISGVLLLLPLPIPFSNLLPAFTVLILASAALERDGLFFVVGCAAFTLTVIFFAGVGFGGVEVVTWLKQWWPWKDVPST